jgi:hypothetical protein
MYYLYASKTGRPPRRVATFTSEQQLLTYARWATLEPTGPRSGKFEQGSVLAGYECWEPAHRTLGEGEASEVEHNPAPHML